MGAGIVGGAMPDTWDTTVAKPKRPEFSGVTEGVVLAVVDAGAAELIFHHDGMIDGHFHHLKVILCEKCIKVNMRFSHIVKCGRGDFDVPEDSRITRR